MKSVEDPRHEFSSCLHTFSCSNIRSILCYAAPGFYSLLFDNDKISIEKIQRTCTHVIFPDIKYDEQ